VGDKTPCTGKGARFPFFRSCVLWSTKTHPWCIRRESMSFPAARLVTRIQEFVTCGSAVPVPVIGTAVIQCAKTQRAACRSVGPQPPSHHVRETILTGRKVGRQVVCEEESIVCRTHRKPPRASTDDAGNGTVGAVFLCGNRGGIPLWDGLHHGSNRKRWKLWFARSPP